MIFGPINTLNSLCNVEITKFHNMLIRDGINQNIGGIIISPKNVLIQFRDEFQFVEGSKDENKLAIIFN